MFVILTFVFVWTGFAQDDSPEDHHGEDLVEAGFTVFTANGCVACHGPNGEGTDVGPALAGHSEFAIRHQVRAPTGIMLVFGPEAISAEELDSLVAYIMSLEMHVEDDDAMQEHGHDDSGISDGDVAFAHHWLLWLALQADDIPIAEHHTAHTFDYLEGVHLLAMQELLTALSNNEIETAQSIIEPMITDVGDFDDDMVAVLLQLIYSAVDTGDTDNAEHFITHFNEFAGDDAVAELGAEVAEHFSEGEFDTVLDMISVYLDGNVNFVKMMHHDDDDDHHDEH